MLKTSYLFRWALFLVVIIFILRTDWGPVFAVFQFQHLRAIAIVQPIQFLLILILVFRFSILSQGSVTRTKIIFRGYLLSVGMNSFLPGRLSELIKLSYLQEKAKIPGSSLVAALVMEKIADVYFLGVFVMFGMGSLWLEFEVYYIAIILVFISICFICLPAVTTYLQPYINKIPVKKIQVFVSETTSAIVNQTRKKNNITILILSGLVWLLSFLLVYVVLFLLLGTSLTIEQTLVVFSSMALGRAIPGLPGGFGTFEAAVIFAMNYLGFDYSVAIATALTLHASQILVVTAVSLVILLTDGTGLGEMLGKIRKLSEKE